MRTSAIETAKSSAAVIASRPPTETVSAPGCSTIRTPAKPTTVAIQRRGPTRSPSIRMATGIIQSETVKLSVMASASGVIFSAEYQAHMAKTPIAARTAKRRNRPRLNEPKPIRNMKGTRIRVPMPLRMKAI